MTLVFPPNGTNTSTTDMNFTWTVVDDHNTTLRCNLTVNERVNISYILTPNDTITNTSVVGFTDGNHTWNVTCLDAHQWNTSETRFFIVDTQGPALDNRTEDPITPTTYNSSGIYNFTINVTDAINAVNNVTLIFNNISYQATRIDLRYNVTLTNLPAGTHNYSWIANDTLNNTNTTSTFTFVVAKAASTVNLTLNGTQGNITINQGGTINITANLTNGTDGTLELFINGTLLDLGSSPLSNITNTTTFTNPGSYNITARYNTTQNFSATTTTYFITVNDTTPPAITLNFPTNNSNTTTNNYNFTWTTTDNFNTTTNCNLTINSAVNISHISTPNNTPTNQSITDFIAGTHTWTVTCTDGHSTPAASASPQCQGARRAAVGVK